MTIAEKLLRLKYDIGSLHDAAYDRGYDMALRDCVPAIVQPTATKQYTPNYIVYYDLSVFMYDDFAGNSYTFNDFVDVEFTSSSANLTVSATNFHNYMRARIIIHVYCEVEQNPEGDFELTTYMDIQPNSDNSINITCNRQSEYYDWVIAEIKGAIFNA